jgi:hypothetical protein
MQPWWEVERLSSRLVIPRFLFHHRRSGLRPLRSHEPSPRLNPPQTIFHVLLDG